VTDYGGEFASVLRAGSVVATQFHPEKSADAGLRFYQNFARWVRETTSPTVGVASERS
jgi:glutamine amidotransferase